MHVRCPHCHNPIEMFDGASLSEITCPSCDSRFSLVGEETVSYRGNERETIGHFELREILGTGAFGTVWKAHDTELDRIVAVKIPRKDKLDPTEAEKFFREARAAAQLKHPGIVAVHEVGREEDTIFIVSDLVDGLSLSDWLTGQQLTCREAAELCFKLCEALEHAHQAGVIHRDLKPTNVLIDGNGEPHVMDFGLAKRTAGEITMTMDGQVLGTPAYMSPEQAKGEGHEADARSDVYSLGVILFELLTGDRPFRGNTRMLIQRVIHEEAPSPRQLNSSIPRDLETICLKCLEEEPNRRYSSAKELSDELQRFLNGESIRARPVRAPARLWRWCKRKPVVASLVVGTLVSLVVGLIVVSALAFMINSDFAAVDVAKEAAIGVLNAQARLAAQARGSSDEETVRVFSDEDLESRNLKTFRSVGGLLGEEAYVEFRVKNSDPMQTIRVDVQRWMFSTSWIVTVTSVGSPGR